MFFLLLLSLFINYSLSAMDGDYVADKDAIVKAWTRHSKTRNFAVATSKPRRVAIFQEDGSFVAEWSVDEEVSSLQWSADGSFLYINQKATDLSGYELISE